MCTLTGGHGPRRRAPSPGSTPGDTASLANGEHVLAARSFDGTDYSPVATRTVYVDNPGDQGGASLPVTVIIAVVAVAGIAGGVLAFYLKRRP
ncbi:MAG: hypothetical protein PHZ19_00885 [Candidatus Thermoplasmatota archaeon]|nr:hypothetical protein [Candidatus Thermoplasmatota archaeon]